MFYSKDDDGIVGNVLYLVQLGDYMYTSVDVQIFRVTFSCSGFAKILQRTAEICQIVQRTLHVFAVLAFACVTLEVIMWSNWFIFLEWNHSWMCMKALVPVDHCIIIWGFVLHKTDDGNATFWQTVLVWIFDTCMSGLVLYTSTLSKFHSAQFLNFFCDDNLLNNSLSTT